MQVAQKNPETYPPAIVQPDEVEKKWNKSLDLCFAMYYYIDIPNGIQKNLMKKEVNTNEKNRI